MLDLLSRALCKTLAHIPKGRDPYWSDPVTWASIHSQLCESLQSMRVYAQVKSSSSRHHLCASVIIQSRLVSLPEVLFPGIGFFSEGSSLGGGRLVQQAQENAE